ncbi:MAG: L,D-transpeptidase family protein [Chloroflexi bacterium]|nr:L,D-transpeptidase family protein [Chloroflexota bacterium]
MSNDQAADLLKQAREAIQAGRKVKARRLLRHSLQADPNNHATWLWLASITQSPEEALTYVKRAEQIKPDHPSIAKAKRWAEKQIETRPPKSAPITESTTIKNEPVVHKPPTLSLKRQWQTAVIRTSLVIIMAILLVGTGWIVWQQNNKPAFTENPVVLAQEISEELPQETGAANGQQIEVTAVAPTSTPTSIQHPAKNISQFSDPRATWTVTPTPSPTPTPTPTIQPTFVSESYGSATRPLGVGLTERWIDVNLSTQFLTAFEGDTAVFSTAVSTGLSNHPTVTGQFRIWLRYESQTMDGARLGYDYYLENVPYVMYFFEDYAIHGAYWHNNFGTPMSHGCVNVHPTDASWLYGWASMGTLVNVHY